MGGEGYREDWYRAEVCRRNYRHCLPPLWREAMLVNRDFPLAGFICHSLPAGITPLYIYGLRWVRFCLYPAISLACGEYCITSRNILLGFTLGLWYYVYRGLKYCGWCWELHSLVVLFFGGLFLHRCINVIWLHWFKEWTTKWILKKLFVGKPRPPTSPISRLFKGFMLLFILKV